MIKETDLSVPTDLPDEGTQSPEALPLAVVKTEHGPVDDLKVDITIQDLSSVVVLPKELEGIKTPAEWDPAMAEAPHTFKQTFMRQMHPVYLPKGKELHGLAKLTVRGLLEFFKVKHPEVEGEPIIYTYEGLVKESEVQYFRYQFADGTSYTYAMDKNHVEFFTSNMCGSDYTWWADRENFNADMLEVTMFGRTGYPVQVYPHCVSKLPIELPIEFFYAADVGPMDHLRNGAFIQLDSVITRFRKEFHERLGEVTRLARKVGMLIKNKDHDLYLSFKGVDFMRQINIGFDRVYPLLPESGELELGDVVIDENDWAEFGRIVQVNVKRIAVAGKHMNKMINRYRDQLDSDEYIQMQFAKELKMQLMASSHFMERIYGFTAQFGMDMVEQVAADVVERLNNKGGNIGLDLNEWAVYQYHDDNSKPTEIVEPGLDFKTNLYNRYTVSFIDALYAYLLNAHHPLIRPYDHREIITEDDGIAIGTIRQV
jgi:hypothetical protein